MSILFLPPQSAGSVTIADATETTSGKIRIATSAEATAGTNDVTAMTPAKVKSVIDASLVGGVTYKGTLDASAPADLSNATKGDLYIISVAGTYAGKTWAVGDHLLVNADMGGTLDSAKIDKVDNTDAVTSVAGRTGAVTLSTADVSGLATVASTGAYSDLSGTPTLGTAAAEDVGTGAGNVVQLDGSAKLPAVDGSQLTNLPSSTLGLNDLTDVTFIAGAGIDNYVLTYDNGSGLWGAEAQTSGVTTLGALSDVTITSATTGEVLRYDGASWVDAQLAYSDLSGTPTLATVATTGAYSDLSGTPTLATVATTGAYSDLSGTPTLGTAAALDVGTSANNVVQLNGSAQLPAVDGSLLTGITADVSSASIGDLSDVTISSATSGQVLSYNGTAWVNTASTSSTPAVTSDSPGSTYTISTHAGLEEIYILTPSVDCTVTIPTASTAGSGYKYNIKNMSANTITINATVDGSAGIDLNQQFSSLTLVSDGSNWFVI